MADKLDGPALMKTTLGVLEKIFSSMPGVVATSPAESAEVDIEDYEGRMRVMDMHVFDSSIYIALVNFYLSAEEMARKKAKGAMIVYLDTEYASKIYKGLTLKFHDDEDDASMLEGCGQLIKLLADSLKKELSSQGFPDLIMAEPQHFKNSVMDGVEYSPDQHKKYQFSFFFFKRKVVVVELTLAPLPSKR